MSEGLSSGSSQSPALAPSQGRVALAPSRGIVVTTYNIGATHINFKINGDGKKDPKFKAKLEEEFKQIMEALFSHLTKRSVHNVRYVVNAVPHVTLPLPRVVKRLPQVISN
jgi:hypothetical protein